ncbi:MAG: glycoside hydrolase family 97 C-terminal domain-containing protein, partial [Acidobacteriota bacterium]
MGEVAAFARRQGNRWFVAVLNSPVARSISLPLSFLGKGAYLALLGRDVPEEPAALKVETNSVSRDGPLRRPPRRRRFHCAIYAGVVGGASRQKKRRH